ncbi:MAG TPA: class I SAM-dependent methyltransferase [Patescibacteria group bacterium]|nr:class I SAM-dependent methyltransferase [Patescibacteria group bacterium]
MYFSELLPTIVERKERLRVARQIVAVLWDFWSPKKLKYSKVLDIGCSSGIITDFVEKFVTSIVGIDVDVKVLPKRKNFIVMDATKLEFRPNSFDIVICNQIYYWFAKPQKLMNEIYRVLKPGGICYFTHVNKYALFEPQYRLPFLSWMSKRVGSTYVRLTGRAQSYDCQYLDFWELEKLCNKFIVHHYTPKILHDPNSFSFTRVPKFLHVPMSFWKILEPLSPNLIWVLEKRAK